MKRIVSSILALFLIMPSVCSKAAVTDQGKAGIHEYILEKILSEPSEDLEQLAILTDINLLSKKMTSDEMSDYIKATKWQARMVYYYSGLTDSGRALETMTPLEFVHSLADDLFQRKALASMVNRKQKEGLQIRRDIMDIAAEGIRMTPDQLDALIEDYISKTF